MKLLVPFKRVLAPDSRIRVLPDGSGIDTESLSWVVNPFDEIALEEAVRLRERGTADSITAVTVGGEAVVDQIRTALAMGADRAIHVLEEEALDPSDVAALLRAVVERELPDLVLMGKQAIDDDCSQVGPMLAGLLGWPQATFVSRVEVLDGGRRLECTRETDAGLEVVRVTLPAVLTTDLRLNEPRYVALPNILRARRKPVESITAVELGVTPRARVRCRGLSAPPPRAPGIRVVSVEELVQRLRDEGGVL